MISSPDLWLPAPELLLLGDDEVHIWRACLNQEPALVQIFLDTLTPDERQRASRFHFQKDRDHFILARGLLRFILSRYLKTSPEIIRFAYNPYGKPAIAEGTSDESLRFNVSHSRGVALYAVTRGREVGLDIESISEKFASLEIAARFFSPREIEMLQALPKSLQTRAFFNCWTRKEAYIKALGEGLSHPLDSFSVSLAPGETPTLLSSEDDPLETSRWSLLEVVPGEGYVAALAIERPAPVLRCWQWEK
ncbi:MAG: 4'-phosphopantetheinyl transferase superfamily protein [Pyrinomonadaceae bacterium]